MKKLFLLFILLTCFFGQAQYTTIPDANFEKALIDLGIDSGVVDGKVLTVNISTITKLDIQKKAIQDLTGIEAFLSLENLQCSSNNLTTLDLSKNTALTDLHITYNKLSFLDFSKNLNLTVLICDNNYNLGGIDISSNTNLKFLNCFGCNIFNLDVSKNTALSVLNCAKNNIKFLELSKNLNLTELNCSGNMLSSLDVSKNTNLKHLVCEFNEILSLDVSKNTALTHLRCHRNKINILDVSKNINLTDLYCGYNQISDLDVSKNLNLTVLSCHDNELNSLDVSKTQILDGLYCGNNKLSSLDVSKNTALTRLACLNNQISVLDVSANTDLTNFICDNNQLLSLDVSKNPKIAILNCNNNLLTDLNLKNGNNKNIDLSLSSYFDLKFNPKLTCIQVDNKTYSDTYWSAKKDATANFSENCSKTTAPIAPPVITATGNQTYCPGTSIKIVTGVTITHDSSETGTDAIYIQISSGYVSGQDLLTLANPLLHPTITTSWSTLEGKLKLSSPTGIPVTYSDFEAAIKDVTFTNSSISPSGTRTFSINLGTGQVSYLPRNKHFYEYFPNLGITWTDAKAAAETKTYYGLQGYLATLTAADESQLAGNQAPGAGWIGGSDAETEGTWKWVTGPEAGTTFWIGKNNGTTTAPDYYANWNTPNEPNNTTNTTTKLNGEDYAHITAPAVGNPGTWNDLSNEGDPPGNYQPKGYIVEFGGMVPGDVDTILISASTTITIPKITSTTPSSRCDSGNITLQATATDGIVNWYTNSTGGTPIATGNSFTIVNLATTTTYYVDATNGSCPNTPRTAITATINTTPTITSTSPASRCDSGTVTLGATASAGTINWYNLPTGGTLLGTGNSFTSPSIASTTTYYVDATAAGCTTPTRTAIIATINIPPTITSILSASRCGSGSVTLGAVPSTGTINWYDVPTGGTSLGTGNSFATPSIASTTTYYVDATESGCTTPTRTAVFATVNISPSITSTTPASRCDSGSVTLGATASAGTINWYDTPTGGTALGTGTAFTTPNLSSTTTYYVDATASGCTTPTRTAIIATVNIPPTITSTSPVSRCDSGTVTLGATASAGTINWYEVPTGGTLLGTGNAFTTPSIASSTTYYVDATISGCTTPTRTAIIASVNISPTITSTAPASRCESGIMTLGAGASAGTINWYDAQTGGTLLGTGNSFTTPNLSSTTTYYVDATTPNCTTPTRTAIIATIHIPPTITSTTPASRCDAGTVTLAATASAGTINWYDLPTGGNVLGTGTVFTTPNLSSTTTYYVDATASGCTTPTRTAITATINTSPTITSTTPASRCDSGTVTLGASASAGTINWYDVPTGGTSLGTGNAFTTPNLTSTTTFYVDATTTGCASPRLPVVATIHPVTSDYEEVILCQSETVTLDASIPGMNYLWSPGGETTQTIVVSSIGDYKVIISSPLANCDSKKDFKVIEHPKPVIKEIVVTENSATIELENPKNYYEFSIDGMLFTDSNLFLRIPSGQYTAFVREKNGCNLAQQNFSIFSIAKYFTPNNDGFNDVWEINEMKNFPNSSASIYDRYGKLIVKLNALKNSWNGNYNNSPLAADDYWYILKMEDSKPEIKGHFTLKR